MAATGKRCKAKNRRGEPCAAYAVSGSDFCYWHDPERAEDRRANSARGGHARHGRKLGATGDADPVVLDTVADVLPILAGELTALLGLEVSVSRARAVGYLAGVVIKAFEVSELQERVAALEVALRLREASK